MPLFLFSWLLISRLLSDIHDLNGMQIQKRNRPQNPKKKMIRAKPDEAGRSRTKPDEAGRSRTKPDEAGRSWTKSDEAGRSWTKLDEFGRSWVVRTIRLCGTFKELSGFAEFSKWFVNFRAVRHIINVRATHHFVNFRKKKKINLGGVIQCFTEGITRVVNLFRLKNWHGCFVTPLQQDKD